MRKFLSTFYFSSLCFPRLYVHGGRLRFPHYDVTRVTGVEVKRCG